MSHVTARHRRGSASLALLLGSLAFVVAAAMFVVPARLKLPLAVAAGALFAACLVFTALDERAERRTSAARERDATAPDASSESAA